MRGTSSAVAVKEKDLGLGERPPGNSEEASASHEERLENNDRGNKTYHPPKAAMKSRASRRPFSAFMNQ